MGLDMYLYARKHEYASSYYKTKKTKLTPAYPADIVKVFPEFSQESVDALPEDERSFRDRRAVKRNTYYEIGYWRKANQVHNFFVQKCGDGVDECQEIYVEKDQLKELKENCEYVLQNKDRAAEVLPTQSGFFFGSTSYDEYYYEDIRHTLDVVNKALALIENDKTGDYDIIYQASWQDKIKLKNQVNTLKKYLLFY